MEHTEHQEAAQSLSRRDASESGSHNVLRRSWHVLSDLMPFSSTALASLPRNLRVREREVRADRIPTNPDARDYGATGETLPPNVRVPKKLATPIKVEGKVWLACERTWISYLTISLLLGTLSIALFNAATDNTTKKFAITYAVVSVGILVYGYVIYQQRITMIRRRHPGHYGTNVPLFKIFGSARDDTRFGEVYECRAPSFIIESPIAAPKEPSSLYCWCLLLLNFKLTLRYLDQIVGPLVIAGALFLAVLMNFIVRLQAL